MNAINLAILCMGKKLQNFCEYKNSLTQLYKDKKIKNDEVETLIEFVKALSSEITKMSDLDYFFYGFSIPQISKEFDLLKIYEDGPIINIELKSQEIELEKIEYQLKKNRYYLSHLGREIFTFCYVKTGKIYSFDGSRLEEVSINNIKELILCDKACIQDNIEKLFRAKDYLISPINMPEKFLRDNYYLTGQQEEIKNKIVNGIRKGKNTIWGIYGAAGTGKTLLLYDIARTLGSKMAVCIIHSGILSQGHIELKAKQREFEIISAKECNEDAISKFECILIDESQRLYQGDFNCLIKGFKEKNIKCIFAYDYYQVLSYTEERRNIPEQLRQQENFVENKLSEKIRTNVEIVSFIKNVINLQHKPRRYMNYRNIEVLYAENYEIAKKIVKYYVDVRDYKFISYTPSRIRSDIDQFGNYANTHHIIGQEFDNVIFSMDKSFRYTAEGRLQGKVHPNPDYIFYKLWFQGVSRAREKLCILIIGNEELFNKILSVKLQFEN